MHIAALNQQLDNLALVGIASAFLGALLGLLVVCAGTLDGLLTENKEGCNLSIKPLDFLFL